MDYTYEEFYFDLKVGREIEFRLKGHRYFIERFDGERGRTLFDVDRDKILFEGDLDGLTVYPFDGNCTLKEHFDLFEFDCIL